MSQFHHAYNPDIDRLIAAEQFQVMGIHTVPVSYGMIKPNFFNVPPLMFSAAIYPNPAPTNPFQYFIDPQ